MPTPAYVLVLVRLILGFRCFDLFAHCLCFALRQQYAGILGYFASTGQLTQLRRVFPKTLAITRGSSVRTILTPLPTAEGKWKGGAIPHPACIRWAIVLRSNSSLSHALLSYRSGILAEGDQCPMMLSSRWSKLN